MPASVRTSPTPPAATVTGERLRLWRRWVGANAWSEAVGLSVSALAAMLLLPRAGSTTTGIIATALAVVAIAAVIEGGVVGWAQHRVLRTGLPAITARRWIGATVLGALAAWMLGMAPSTAIELTRAGAATDAATLAAPPVALQVTLAVLLGLVAGPILGGAQALVLREHVPRAWWWLPANAAAWAAGMPLVFVVAGGVPPGWAPPLVAAVVVATLGLVGAVVGAVHGAVLVRLIPAVPAEPRPDGRPHRSHRFDGHHPPQLHLPPRRPVRRELP